MQALTGYRLSQTQVNNSTSNFFLTKLIEFYKNREHKELNCNNPLCALCDKKSFLDNLKINPAI